MTNNKFLFVRRPWIWLKRFRKRRGYGVHSPWAFSLIDGVILECGRYYAYDSLNKLHPWPVRMLKLYPLQCRRLLFRLANWVHPSSVLIFGDAPIETAYIRAAVPEAEIIGSNGSNGSNGSDGLDGACKPKMPNKPINPKMFSVVEKCSMVFVSSSHLLSYEPSPCALCILEGIHSSREAFAKWREVQKNEAVGITFDLYTYGLVFFDRSRHKQHYIVNF